MGQGTNQSGHVRQIAAAMLLGARFMGEGVKGRSGRLPAEALCQVRMEWQAGKQEGVGAEGGRRSQSSAALAATCRTAQVLAARPCICYCLPPSAQKKGLVSMAQEEAAVRWPGRPPLTVPLLGEPRPAARASNASTPPASRAGMSSRSPRSA